MRKYENHYGREGEAQGSDYKQYACPAILRVARAVLVSHVSNLFRNSFFLFIVITLMIFKTNQSHP